MGNVSKKGMSKLRAYIREIYQSRSYLHSLVRKDLIGRYKNSVFGFSWHFIIPVILSLVYYIMFSSGIRSSPVDNFVVYLLSALFPFTFMVSCITGGSGCITGNAMLIKKVYFPREIIVLSYVVSNYIVALIGYSISLLIIVGTGHPIGFNFLFILPMWIIVFIFGLGCSLLFSSMNVYVRDIQYFLGSINMVFMFLTPLYFLPDTVSGLMKTVVTVNPLTYYVEAFHHCIYYGTYPDIVDWGACVLIALLLFFIGLLVFNKTKRGFVERL